MISVDTMVFKAWPVHSSPACPPRYGGKQASSPGLVLGRFWKRAVRSLAAGSGAGRDPTAWEAQKHFPLHYGVQASFFFVHRGAGSRHWGPQMATAGPHPCRQRTPYCPPPSQGSRGSAGVNDLLEVKTPKKLQGESRNLSR